MKATTLLIITCLILYPVGILHGDLLAFSYNNFIVRQEWWTLITAPLIHANLAHLLGNMLFLFLFGRALERLVGPARLILCFFTGSILSLLCSYFFYPSDQAIVGASGGISTIIGLLMIYNPWKISFLLNFFPMPLGVAALTYMVLNFYLAHSRSNQRSGLHTAYELHIMGFLVGIVLGIFWNKDWKKNLLISILSFIGFYIILGIIIYYFKYV